MAAGLHFGDPPPLFDCRVCRHDRSLRQEWGCEDEQADPVDEFSCWRCKEFHEREDCGICGGTGIWKIHRCPNALLRGHWRETAICEAGLLLEKGILPGGVAWLEQPATWTDAVRHVDTQRHRYNEMRERRLRQGSK